MNLQAELIDLYDESSYVSTPQVAEALGVGVSTVKRWVDDGKIPARKTVGGHRKLRWLDVVRFAHEGNRPQHNLNRVLPVTGSGTEKECRSFISTLVQALKNSDIGLVRTIVHGAYQHGCSLAEIGDDLIAPAMHQIGHDWSSGKIDIFQEHRATQCMVAVLYELQACLVPCENKGRLLALGGAPEHDHSLLPSLLCKLVLVDIGWEAVNLGPHTPIEVFAAAMEKIKPALLWISVSHLVEREHFIAAYQSLYANAEKHGIAVALGGMALTQDVRSGLTYTFFGDGLKHLEAFANSFHPRQSRRRSPS